MEDEFAPSMVGELVHVTVTNKTTGSKTSQCGFLDWYYVHTGADPDYAPRETAYGLGGKSFYSNPIAETLHAEVVNL